MRFIVELVFEGNTFRIVIGELAIGRSLVREHF
jgi:hypothetical protein